MFLLVPGFDQKKGFDAAKRNPYVTYASDLLVSELYHLAFEFVECLYCHIIRRTGWWHRALYSLVPVGSGSQIRLVYLLRQLLFFISIVPGTSM